MYRLIQKKFSVHILIWYETYFFVEQMLLICGFTYSWKNFVQTHMCHGVCPAFIHDCACIAIWCRVHKRSHLLACLTH